MPLIRFCTSSTPKTASSTAAAPASPLSSACWARSAWAPALPAICEAVRANSSMAAVISTTEAACSEEPEARSEAIWLTALAADATSTELPWICCARMSRALVALVRARASVSGSRRAWEAQVTRSPERRRSSDSTSTASTSCDRHLGAVDPGAIGEEGGQGEEQEGVEQPARRPRRLDGDQKPQPGTGHGEEDKEAEPGLLPRFGGA